MAIPRLPEPLIILQDLLDILYSIDRIDLEKRLFNEIYDRIMSGLDDIDAKLDDIDSRLDWLEWALPQLEYNTGFTEDISHALDTGLTGKALLEFKLPDHSGWNSWSHIPIISYKIKDLERLISAKYPYATYQAIGAYYVSAVADDGICISLDLEGSESAKKLTDWNQIIPSPSGYPWKYHDHIPRNNIYVQYGPMTISPPISSDRYRTIDIWLANGPEEGELIGGIFQLYYSVRTQLPTINFTTVTITYNMNGHPSAKDIQLVNTVQSGEPVSYILIDIDKNGISIPTGWRFLGFGETPDGDPKYPPGYGGTLSTKTSIIWYLIWDRPAPPPVPKP